MDGVAWHGGMEGGRFDMNGWMDGWITLVAASLCGELPLTPGTPTVDASHRVNPNIQPYHTASGVDGWSSVSAPPLPHHGSACRNNPASDTCPVLAWLRRQLYTW